MGISPSSLSPCTLRSAAAVAVDPMPPSSSSSGPCSPADLTLDLPDECLAVVFHALSAADRNSCSLVCRRWHAVDAGNRQRLSLDARAALAPLAPAILARFRSVSKLTLRCDRRAGVSIGDEAAAAVAAALPSLARLKLRGLRSISDAGLAGVAANAHNLRKLSCVSCSFGPKAIAAVLVFCPNLEDLSIKRLRGGGIFDPVTAAGADNSHKFPSSVSLRSICLKDLNYNAQCFIPLITASSNLRSVKIIACSGPWDTALEAVASSVPGLAELHLEKLQVSDAGLAAISKLAALEVLFLVKTLECTDRGVCVVADRCGRLRKLYLDGWRAHRIGDTSLAAVARGCPLLQELVLIGVGVTILSIELIARCCRVLERLALCSCEGVGDSEIACLAASCFALKKLCIKGCPVSDAGMEALARGCPSLVKVKLKRCSAVTPGVVERMKAVRGETPFSVTLDSLEPPDLEPVEQDAVSVSDHGGPEPPPGVVDHEVAQMADLAADHVSALDIGSSSNDGQPSGSGQQPKNRMRSFVTAALKRLSNGGNPPPPPHP